MKTKTIFVVVITALITIILMKNTDRVDFWIFGVHSVPKLAVLAVFFIAGIVVGTMLVKRKMSRQDYLNNQDYLNDQDDPGMQNPFPDPPGNLPRQNPPLDPSDEEYIR